MKYTKILATTAATIAVMTSALFLNQKDANAATVATTTNKIARLYTDTGKLITNRALGPNTPWLVGKIITINNETMYQVATNEYLRANDSTIDYGDNQQNNTQTNADLALTSENISRYFTKYLNELHRVNGTASVQATDDMNNYATERVNQQSYATLDHSTASRNKSENLGTMGLNMFNSYHMNAKQAAYSLLSAWYNEDNNVYGIGQRGHFGHRAALIYSGPNVGLAVNDDDAAFEADWNIYQLDGFHSIYNYVGDGQPNTKWISADSIN